MKMIYFCHPTPRYKRVLQIPATPLTLQVASWHAVKIVSRSPCYGRSLQTLDHVNEKIAEKATE